MNATDLETLSSPPMRAASSPTIFSTSATWLTVQNTVPSSK
jgi:hypothetical protein